MPKHRLTDSLKLSASEGMFRSQRHKKTAGARPAVLEYCYRD
jgi:hypothetical protein